MPRVSVIIPAYNAAPYLRQTIQSVLNQNFQDLEILVIDDGSKDDTWAIATSYGTPVRCIHKENSGVSRTRNLGIEQSSGEYVAFLDADDLWEPAKLGKQVTLLDHSPNVGLCFTAVQRVDPQLRLLGITGARDYSDFGTALLLYSCVVTGSCSSAMARRELLQRVGGFDPRFSTCADWELWLRLSQLTQFTAINEPLVKIRVVPGSMSSDPSLVERDTFAVLDSFLANDLPSDYRLLAKRIYSNHWMILSGCHLHAGRWCDSLRCMGQSLRLYPFNVTRPLGMPIRWLKRCLPLTHTNA